MLGEHGDGLHDGGWVGGLEAGESWPREVEEVGKELVEPLRFLHEDLKAFATAFGGSLAAGKNAGGSTNAGERVADLMREAGGELTRGGEPFGLLETIDILL